MADRDWRALAYEYGPYGIVSVLFAFMLWVRTLPADRVIDGGTVYFSGNDPWYHARIVHVIVGHFPGTPNYDPWSYFPYGTGRHSGFGGLFDQLIALASLVVGGGSPSPHTVNLVVAYAPAVFGAATVIPIYLIARHLTDRWSGLIAAGLIAVLGGQFLSRTVVSSADHQSAEAFFASLAVFGFLYAVAVAYTENPTTADLRDRNWIALRRPVMASVLGGMAIASYLMMWPPGLMIVFVFGVFAVVQLMRDHVEGTPTEYLTIGVGLAMVAGSVPTLLYVKTLKLSGNSFSPLQPLVLLGIAAGVVVLWYLSAYVEREGYDRTYYPPAVIALIAGVLIVAAVVYPRSVDLWRSLVVRVYSFGIFRSQTALTVAEIQPGSFDRLWNTYGVLMYVAAAGWLVMVGRVVRERRPAELLIGLWSFAMLSAYFSMIRFGYYMTVVIAILAGFAIWWTGTVLLDLTEIREPADLDTYQIIGVVIILIAVVPGNVVAMQDRQPVWETAPHLAGANTAWQNELEWVRGNTPEIPMEYDRRYERPADDDFAYPKGAYGVMSWWDYGHWITVTGHRIPNANPFQQGPNTASAYLQARNETRANLILDALPSKDRIDSIPDASSERLREVVRSQSQQRANENTRYVMIDDQMAAGKFSAIATWTGPGFGSYVTNREVKLAEGTTARLPVMNERYYDTMLGRLYFRDANGMEHYRLVHETEAVTSIASVARQTQSGYRATNVLNRRVSSDIFNAVQNRPDLRFYDTRQESRVKTFERVEGATLSGTVDSENATSVTAVLRLRTNTGRNFTYITRTEIGGNGEFAVTVPYPTNDAVSPSEGGTDSGVEAIGNYTLFAGSVVSPAGTGSAAVPESAIYEGREIAVGMQTPDRPKGGNASALSPPGGIAGVTGSSDRPIAGSA